MGYEEDSREPCHDRNRDEEDDDADANREPPHGKLRDEN